MGIIFSFSILGQAGASLDFDGVDDRVEIADAAWNDFGAGDFTVECWIKKQASSSAFSNIAGVGKWNTGATPGSNEWILTLSSGGNNNIPNFTVEVGNVRYSATATTDLTIGIWYHIAGVREGTSIKIYINGVLEGTTTDAGITNINNVGRTLVLGKIDGQANTTNMEMDELRIWSKARTITEINTIKNCEIELSAANLLANYHFNQGVADGNNVGINTLVDVGGSNYNGTLFNFGLNSSASNWVSAGSPASSVVCNIQNITINSYFNKIQDAIDDASTSSGDIISIPQGTYSEILDAATPIKDLTFAPGASPGCVTILGLVLNSGDVLDMEIDGVTPCTQHDQFTVNGSVDLGGASLNPIITHTFVSGDEIILIDNDGVDAVTGTFAQGSSITISGIPYQILYDGGTGNDVVLRLACGDVCAAPVTYTGNITLSTQAQINAFKNPSNCKYTHITGTITLDGNGNAAASGDATGPDPITSLCNLSELLVVGGSMTIRDFNVGGNPTDLSDLSKLDSIGNNLTIGDGNANDSNSSFTNAVNIPNLKHVGNNVLVQNNPNITQVNMPSLDGNINALTIHTNGTSVNTIDFTALDTILATANLNNNAANNTNANVLFNNLKRVGTNLTLTRTASALNLTNLESVGNNLTIDYNSNLTSLNAPALAEVVNNLSIDNDSLLTTINIPTQFVSPSASLSITGDTSLNTVNVGVISTTGNIIIQNNGTLVSAITLDKLVTVGGSNNINNNPANATSANINLSALTSVVGNIVITRSASVLDISSLKSIGNSLTVDLNSNLTSFNAPVLEEVVNNLSIDNDSLLTSINIPTQFVSPSGSLSITGDTSLNTVNVGIISTTGNITIQSNKTLVSTITLDKLVTVGGAINMNNNVANATSANVNLSSLTSVTGNVIINRTINALNATALTGIGGNLTLNNNPVGWTDFDVSFAALTTVAGNLTVQNNAGLGTCCLIPCRITAAMKTVSGNTGNCATLAIATTTCAPTTSITPDPAEVCAGIDLVLDGNPSNGTTPFAHAWTGIHIDSLNDATIQSPTFNAANSGSFMLTYTVTDDNGCTASDDISITVLDNPIATITPDPAAVCPDTDIILDGNPSGGSGTFTTHLWSGIHSDSLDDNSIQAPTFTSANSDSFDLTYSVTDDKGCVGSDNITIAVFETPSISTSVDGTSLDNAGGQNTLTIQKCNINNEVVATAITQTNASNFANVHISITNSQNINSAAGNAGDTDLLNDLPLDGTIISVGATWQNFIDDIRLQNAAIWGFATIKVRPYSDVDNSGSLTIGDCLGDSITITIQVQPIPNTTRTYVNPTTHGGGICSGDMVKVNLGTNNFELIGGVMPTNADYEFEITQIRFSTDMGATYPIGNSGYPVALSGGTYTVGNIISGMNAMLSETFTNNTNTPVYLRYQIMAQLTNAPFCQDGPYNIEVVINPRPIINNPIDLVACDSIALPTITGTSLTGNEGYYTGLNGTGSKYLGGSFVSTSGTYYAYDSTMTSPTCFDQDTFIITITKSPNITNPTDILGCNSIMLPAIAGTNLTGNEGYYTGSGGTGVKLNAGDLVIASSTYYVYDSTLSSPTCFDQDTFLITINKAITSLTIDAVPSGDLCQGTTTKFVATAAGATGTLSYAWCAHSTSVSNDCIGGFIAHAQPDTVSRLWNTAGDKAVSVTVSQPGCPDSIKRFAFNVINCAAITFKNDHTSDDPCSCKNDQTVNGAKDGTFNETVTVTPTTPGQTWTVVAINRLAASGGAPMGVSMGDLLTFNAGVHEISFMHSDSAGYSIIVEGPNPVVGTPGSPALGNIQLTESNICKYPVIAFDPALKTDYCTSEPSITLGVTELSNFVGEDTTFTIDMSIVTMLQPSSLSIGAHALNVVFKGDSLNNTSTNIASPAFPGCLTSLNHNFNISPVPSLQITVNGVQVTSDNNGVNESGSISFCNSLGGDLTFTQFVDTSSYTPAGQVKVWQEFTKNNVTFAPADGIFPLSAYPTPFVRNATLTNTNMPGNLIMKFIAFVDANNNDIIDIGECIGDTIIYDININAVPRLETVINGVMITSNNDGVTDEAVLDVCNGDPNNIEITAPFIDLNGVTNTITDTVRVWQSFTTENANFTPWCNNCQDTLGAYKPIAFATASLVNPSSPGAVIISFVPWVDSNNNRVIDANECKGDTVRYFIFISETPRLSATLNDVNISSNNDGITDVANISVCSGITNNVSITAPFTDLNNVAGTVKVYQTFTTDNATINNICNNCEANINAFVPGLGGVATASLIDPLMTGNVTISLIPWIDTNNNDLIDGNECAGDTVRFIISVTNTPRLRTVVNDSIIISENNGTTISKNIFVCDGTINNVEISAPFADLNNVANTPTDTVRVWQSFTTDNATFSPWCNNCQDTLGAYKPVAQATAALINAANPGTVTVSFIAWVDRNNNRMIDIGECVGDTVRYVINISTSVKPIITVHPMDVYVCETQDATLSVTATGPALYYQWQEFDGAMYNDIPGANGSTHTVTNVLDFDKMYRVVVHANYGLTCQDSTLSLPARILIGSDGAIVCNDLVNISLDDNCEAEITPGMILKGTMAHSMFSVQVVKPGFILAGDRVDYTYVNKLTEVRVYDNCSGNFCWGKIYVEDKLPPTIVCGRDTLVNCYDTTDFTKAPNLPLVMDNCQPGVIVQVLLDSLGTYPNCIGDTIACRVIKYQAIDASNNKSAICTRKIYYKKANLMDVLIPKNYDGLPGNNPTLSCDFSWETGVKNMYPDPHETGRPYFPGTDSLNSELTFQGVCKMQVVFEDDTITLCKGSFKVIRKWTIIDWCTRDIRVEFQIIKIEDNQGPEFTIPNIPNVVTDPYQCAADWIAPHPTNIIDCAGNADYTYTVEFKIDTSCSDVQQPEPYHTVFGESRAIKILTGPNAGKWLLKKLPVGCVWLKYTVTDPCGNSTSKYVRIRIADGTAPVAVCDEFTVVTLSANGNARIYAISFDDGSHDNCSDVTLEVRRMTPGCGQDTITWRNYVDICCEDPGRLIQVEMKVTDASGNTNVCMVNVETQDKIMPTFVCPQDVTIGCGADTSAIATGKPVRFTPGVTGSYYDDNCSNVGLTWTNRGTLNSCGEGIIIRTYIVSDLAGNSKVCEQTITVRNLNLYNGPSWATVGTKEIKGCIVSDIKPAVTGSPTLNAVPCSKVSMTYDDQVFSNLDGVCYKILRRWTVIDWCKFRSEGDPVTYRWPNEPTEGVNKWSTIQIIKVTDDTKPVITEINANRIFQTTDATCSGDVVLTETGTDCSPAATAALKWTYTVRRNGNIYRSGNGTGGSLSASGNYEVGSYEITWRAEDLCGNFETKVYTFTLRDNKKPTPYCHSALITVVMPSVGSVGINARNFNVGSFDNCSGPLVFSFSSTYPVSIADSVRTFTCADFPVGKDTIHRSLRMYVWDQAGNFDFCTVTVVVQKNAVCNPLPLVIDLGGRIVTQNNVQMNEVAVHVTDEVTTIKDIHKTDTKGDYIFNQMSSEGNYVIKPEKNDQHINGISTLDLVMIQQHILGVRPFTSPYQLLAADANNDGKVSAADLVEMRKLILGIFDEFPKNKSWRFYEKGQEILDLNNPWGLNEAIVVFGKGGSKMYNDFLGIKTGDMNTSATANMGDQEVGPRNSSAAIKTDDRKYSKGQSITVDFTADDIMYISGIQGAFTYDADKLSYSRVNAGGIDISPEHMYVDPISGTIHFSWAAMGLEKNVSGKVLFSLVFDCIGNGLLSDALKMSSEKVKSEYYSGDLTEHNLKLSYHSLQIEEMIEIGQNTPNPFVSDTRIYVNMPEDGKVYLKLYDNSGKVILSKTENFFRGKNEFTIQNSDIEAPGVYIYEVTYNNRSFMKKMIKISE